jgi:heptosyltransferase-2
VDLSLDLLRADGIDVDDGRNENWVAADVGAKADRLLSELPPARPRVFLAPRSTDEDRNWPLDRMAELIRWLIEDHGCEIVLCGAKGDLITHRRLAAALPPAAVKHLHDFSRECSLRETAALLSRMDLCVGVDSGLPHVAASFGVPVVTLSGAADPRQWHPWKTQAAVVVAADGSRTMLGIMVGQVQAAIDRLFAEAGVMEKAHRRGLRTLDLRTGSYRYEIFGTSSHAPADSPTLLEPATPAPETAKAA